MKQKKKITRNELEKLYSTMLNKDLCKLLSISPQTLNNYLKSNGIRLKGKGNRSRKTKVKIL